jgi:hypothetical protein
MVLVKFTQSFVASFLLQIVGVQSKINGIGRKPLNNIHTSCIGTICSMEMVMVSNFSIEMF